MKQFLKLRVLPLLLVFSFLVPVICAPAAAVTFPELVTIRPEAIYDYDLLQSELKRLINEHDSDNCAFVTNSYYLSNSNNWTVVSQDTLSLISTFWNYTYQDEFSITAQVVDTTLDDGTKLSYIRAHLKDSVYQGREALQWCFTDGAYNVLVAPIEDSEEDFKGVWISEERFIKSEKKSMLSLEALTNLANDVGADLAWNDMYYYIYRDDGCLVYADLAGLPYASFRDSDAFASQTERPSTSVEGEEEVDEGFDAQIDLENGVINLPDGTLAFLDAVIYDESTKSYYFDSHDVTNNYYYYHYEYHINYTSITYIGQTEEYNKYYEVYYELPDGRDSADLTKEDLEQLNVSIDVIPYARNVDDTSLRSLYHFDGDTRDASYWSYCTDFVWNEGASLTYMDAGVFEGALYLDEQEHEFTFTLPSNITADDFTLQWRYYQSHTEAPVTDSYINFGDEMVLQWSGGYFSDPDGEALHVTPTGTWNEVALIRDSGVIYYYLNGVCMGSLASTYSYRDTITFHFGDEQQTFKYFDELRFLDYALQTGGANYTPTAVPHDTNLSLTVPTESVPVADEYWSITNTPGYLSYIDFTTGAIPENVVATTKPTEIRDNKFPGWGYLTDKMDIQYFDGYAELTRISNTFGSSDGLMYGGLHSYVAYYSKLGPTASGSQYYGGFTQLQDYTVTIIHRDGTIEKLPLYYEETDAENRYICSVDASFGKVYIYRVTMSGAMNVCLVVYPERDVPVELVGIEVCVGESQLEAEWVESVTIFDEESLTTPTLAVRTDLEITSHQIGGVRPSVPEKGMVWALVENQRITSLQIYNGQAWEGVDGRIWTGTRWIPASSYNIITLQDMYDIVDATPDYEYIYTESGFWSWWQKSWNAFQEKLFSALGSGGSGGSTAPSTLKDAVANALSSLIEGVFGVITEVLKAIIGAVTDILSGIFGFFTDTVFGGIKDFFGSFEGLTDPFESTTESGDGTVALPEGVAGGFSFISGVFGCIPAPVQGILIFGIATLVLLSVLVIVL